MENDGQEIAFSRFLENYEIHEDEIDMVLSNVGAVFQRVLQKGAPAVPQQP